MSQTITHRPFAIGRTSLLLLLLVLACGIFLRAWPSAGYHKVGYDEEIYSRYVFMAATIGPLKYHEVVRAYLETQTERPDAVVPATRVGFLWPAAVLARVFHLKPTPALHAVSLGASILLLLAASVIGYRTGGAERMLLVTALMAAAPLQIYLAQRSLIDGYFALWAVLCAWFLWEHLRQPRAKVWLLSYGTSLFLMVLTKENAAFVFFALMGTLGVFYALRFNRPAWPLLVVSAVAPALAVIVLACLVGGLAEWISFYRMFVEKSRTLPYPVRFQDGAWFRYLVDFTLISPCIVALVFGRIFHIGKEAKADIYWAVFLGLSYVLMACVSYAASLRFAAYWDLPLRWLAASELLLIAQRWPRPRAMLLLCGAVLLLVALDLQQYWRYFVDSAIYDPVSSQLLHAAKLVK